MTWTKDKPTLGGWYLVKPCLTTSNMPVGVVEVKIGSLRNGADWDGRLILRADSYVGPVDEIRDRHLWLGPLDMPSVEHDFGSEQP